MVSPLERRGNGEEREHKVFGFPARKKREWGGGVRRENTRCLVSPLERRGNGGEGGGERTQGVWFPR